MAITLLEEKEIIFTNGGNDFRLDYPELTLPDDGGKEESNSGPFQSKEAKVGAVGAGATSGVIGTVKGIASAAGSGALTGAKKGAFGGIKGALIGAAGGALGGAVVHVVFGD